MTPYIWRRKYIVSKEPIIFLGGKSSGRISQVAGPEARVNAIRDSWGNSSFSQLYEI